jgi:hypothetical protein
MSDLGFCLYTNVDLSERFEFSQVSGVYTYVVIIKYFVNTHYLICYYIIYCSTLVHSVPVYVFIIHVMNNTIPSDIVRYNSIVLGDNYTRLGDIHIFPSKLIKLLFSKL